MHPTRRQSLRHRIQQLFRYLGIASVAILIGSGCLHSPVHDEPVLILDQMPPGVRSPKTMMPAGMLIRNKSSRNLEVNWIDFRGDRHPQCHIPAGKTASIGARVGHAFVIEAEDPNNGPPEFARVAFADFPTGEVIIQDSDFDTSETHDVTTIEGWTIRLEKNMPAADVKEVSAVLQEKLAEVKRLIPRRHVKALKDIVIWVDIDTGAKKGQYHAGVHWMENTGWHLHKRMAIHFCSPGSLVEFAKTQPMVVLHELSHAYHHQVLGFDHKKIEKAFEHAEQAGLYDRVKHVSGKTVRAYAMTNDREYFAELTEAYFGLNDFFPFTREELRLHDPKGYKMIQDAWDVK